MCLFIHLSKLQVLSDASPAWIIFFLIFSQGWFDSFPLYTTTYSFTSALIIALIPCLPPYIPVSPCFYSPLSLTCSRVPTHSFLSPHAVTIPPDLNEFYVYFSLLINKWLKRTARWGECEDNFRNRVVGCWGHSWSNKLPIEEKSGRKNEGRWKKEYEGGVLKGQENKNSPEKV